MTRDEIEAACEIVTGHSSRVRLQPADVLLPAMRMLADWAIVERAERRRRIEAAARKIEGMVISLLLGNGVDLRKHRIVITSDICDTITRCLDGETI